MERTIALAHGGTTIHTSAARSQAVRVGTTAGIVRLERSKGGWREAGSSLRGLHVSAIVEPEPGIVLAGAFHGSIHRSIDDGASWERSDHGLTQDDVYALAWVKGPSGIRVYAGTEPAHLFVSDDLGLHWTELPAIGGVPGTERWTFPAPPHVAHVKHITFHPEDPSHLYVSIEQGGLLESYDGGQTFDVVTGMDDDVHRVVLHPTAPRRMWVTGGEGIYATEDAGSVWAHRTTREDDEIGGYPDQLVYVPSQPETLFVAAAHRNPGTWPETNSARGRISRSENGGETWEPLGGGLPDGLKGNIEAMTLEESPDGVSLFAATTAGEVFASDNCGKTWACIADELPPISKGGHYQMLRQHA